MFFIIYNIIFYSIVLGVPEYLLEGCHWVEVLIELLELVLHLVVVYILVDFKLVPEDPFVESVIRQEDYDKSDSSDNRE